MHMKIIDFLLNWPLSGERRRAWNRQRVITIVLLLVTAILVLIAIANSKLGMLIPAVIIVLIGYQIYLWLTRQSRLQLLNRERQSSQEQVNNAKNELLNYAAELEG